jgi:hypothetical protein
LVQIADDLRLPRGWNLPIAAEEQAPSNFFKERWAASYDPARKITYVSWFLGTIAYFLDRLDFTSRWRARKAVDKYR